MKGHQSKQCTAKGKSLKLPSLLHCLISPHKCVPSQTCGYSTTTTPRNWSLHLHRPESFESRRGSIPRDLWRYPSTAAAPENIFEWLVLVSTTKRRLWIASGLASWTNTNTTVLRSRFLEGEGLNQNSSGRFAPKNNKKTTNIITCQISTSFPPHVC